MLQQQHIHFHLFRTRLLKTSTSIAINSNVIRSVRYRPEQFSAEKKNIAPNIFDEKKKIPFNNLIWFPSNLIDLNAINFLLVIFFSRSSIKLTRR